MEFSCCNVYNIKALQGINTTWYPLNPCSSCSKLVVGSIAPAINLRSTCNVFPQLEYMQIQEHIQLHLRMSIIIYLLHYYCKKNTESSLISKWFLYSPQLDFDGDNDEEDQKYLQVMHAKRSRHHNNDEPRPQEVSPCHCWSNKSVSILSRNMVIKTK